MIMLTQWISWFEEFGQDCNDLVGKKCANLGEMTRLGLRVPPGFALSVDAYKDFMSLTGAGEEIKQYLSKAGYSFEKIQHFNEASAELRDIVESKELPSKMKETILSYYEELCNRCEVNEAAVAARSAGAASHPGQYETHLNVRGKTDLIEKIVKVWSSSFNPRSLSSRHRLGLPLESDPIGVAVLKMVNARAAGVLFTADPNTGDRSKMAEEETPFEKKTAYCLSDEEAKEIGRLGKLLEAHFNVPQDSEWAIDEDFAFPESVILLQTRPEVIAQRKKPVDQVVDMMLTRFIKR
ncbi:MAG: PEP/pyruvate-binding domain-containing protein [Deltaproteobacteria bacterium]